MKICPVCKKQFPNKSALANHIRTTHNQRNMSRRRNQNSRAGANNLVMAQREFWGEVPEGKVATLDIKPSLSQLVKLAAQAALYEQYKVTKFIVHVSHTASANSSGQWIAGVTKTQTPPTGFKQIAGMSPNVHKAITQDGSLTVPCARFMEAPWRDTVADSLGYVHIHNGGSKNSGALSIWVSYSVVFAGPMAPANHEYTFVYDNEKAIWRDEQGNTITEVHIPYDYLAQLDVVADDTVFDRIANAVNRVIIGLNEISRLTTGILRSLHFLANAASFILPNLGAPAIIHFSPRFRPPLALWRSIGVRGIETEDSNTRELFERVEIGDCAVEDHGSNICETEPETGKSA